MRNLADNTFSYKFIVSAEESNLDLNLNILPKIITML